MDALQKTLIIAVLSAVGAVVWLSTDLIQRLEAAETAQQVHYCNDSEASTEWAKIMDKNPNDPAVLHLAAYQLGFCALAESGRVTHEVAGELFELERARVIHRRKLEETRNTGERAL